MKKRGGLFIVFVLLSSVILFSSCSVRPKKMITITLWHYYSAKIKTRFDALVQEFNETVGRQKGILVDAHSQGGVNELANAVFAAAVKDVGAREMPDIFAAYSDNVFRLDKLGLVADVTPYFTEKELSAYRREFLSDGRFGEDGTLKILPIAKSTELLFINQTAFGEFTGDTGVSSSTLATWEGLAKTAKDYYEWSGGKALFGFDSVANFMFLASKQLGQDLFVTKNGIVECTLTAESAKKIWDVCYVPYVSGHYASIGRFRSDDVKTGSLVMFTGSTSSASFFPKVIETGKLTSFAVDSAVLPYPTFEGKKPYSIHQGAGMVITKQDKKTEKACVEFLKWFTAAEQNMGFTVPTSYLPVQNKALSYEITVRELGTDDPNHILVQSARAIYNMFDTHELYAAPPFEKSFEVRIILDKSLLSFAKADREAVLAQVNSGLPQEKVLAAYTGDENFLRWYNQFRTEIQHALSSE